MCGQQNTALLFNFIFIRMWQTPSYTVKNSHYRLHSPTESWHSKCLDRFGRAIQLVVY